MVKKSLILPQILKETLPFLKFLHKNRFGGKRVFDLLLSRASPKELLSIVEIALNILKGRVPLNPKERSRLKVHVRTIRLLSRARSPDTARRILRGQHHPQNQIGSGFPALAALASVIVPIISEILSKAYSHRNET